MQTSRLVRQHRTPAQREDILRDYSQSPLAQKEFALQAGIRVSALQAWRRKAPGRPASAGADFVAVPHLLPVAAAAPAYRLQWPGGLSLEVRPGFASQELAFLLQLLPPL